MRKYKITIYSQDSTTVLKEYSADGNGLAIEFDANIADMSVPRGNSNLRIYGVELETIKYASQFNDMFIEIYAGMSRGMPLANPEHYGLILSGRIFQCFGNYVGVDSSIDFIIAPDTRKKRIILDCPATVYLNTAVKSAIASQYPDYKVIDNTTKLIKNDKDEKGIYTSLVSFADYVKAQSQRMANDAKYSGILIKISASNVIMYDNYTQSRNSQIAFKHMIGQPTWIDAGTIAFATTMRADINLGDTVTMQKVVSTLTPNAALGENRRNSLTVDGDFMITTVRHIGNFRGVDPYSWATLFEGVRA